MYTLWRGMHDGRAAWVEVPTLAASVAIAEFFYKFHSFSLECLAFLATWFVLGGAVSAVAGKLARR